MTTERDLKKMKRAVQNFNHHTFGRKRRWKKRVTKWGNALNHLVRRRIKLCEN